MREIVYGILILLGTLLPAPLHSEPSSLAGPSLSGTVPARAAVQGRLETGAWWMTGEIPGGSAADPALHGRLAAGHRAAQRFCGAGSWCEGMALTVTPVMRMVLDTPGRAPTPAPQAGLALLEDLAWPFRPGLRLSASAGLGDRVALGLPLPLRGGPALAVKFSAGIGAELDRFGGPPLDLRFSVNAATQIAGAEMAAQREDCSLQFEVATKGGAPFHVSAPCGKGGTIGFGLRAAF